MFSPEFIEQLADAVAIQVINKLSNQPGSTTQKRLLSTEEAASYLGLPNASSLRQRKSGGQIPETVYMKMGGSVLYDRIALDKWIDELKPAA
jgi:predicted DNA-binding transcriptional regulator AlpA